MIWQLIGVLFAGAQLWLCTAGELHRCPVCRENEIQDVERHWTIFHPGVLTSRQEANPELGVDPRPHEALVNVISLEMLNSFAR